MKFSTHQKILIATVAHRVTRLARAAVGRPMQGMFCRGGINWSLDLDEGIDFAIWLLGAFERDLVRFYSSQIKPGSIVLDIGANVGAHTLHFARAVGSAGKVYAFEATSYAFKKLEANVSANPLFGSRVSLHHTLLVADPGSTTETSIASSWPLAGSRADNETLGGALKSIGEASVCKLDATVSACGVDRVDWIKIDVDGHEIDVLRGSSDILARDRPKIIIELAPYCFRGTHSTFADLIDLLVAHDYALFTIPRLTPLPMDPVILEQAFIPRDGSINALAVPSPVARAERQ